MIIIGVLRGLLVEILHPVQVIVKIIDVQGGFDTDETSE